MANGGDGQDICTFFASFINQRQQIERLLNWLRESQTTCTDTNCFDSISGFPGTEQGSALLPNAENDRDCQDSIDQNPLALVMLFVLGLLTIYAMNLNRNQARPIGQQPKSHQMRRSPDDHDENRRNDNNGGGSAL